MTVRNTRTKEEQVLRAHLEEAGDGWKISNRGVEHLLDRGAWLWSKGWNREEISVVKVDQDIHDG